MGASRDALWLRLAGNGSITEEARTRDEHEVSIPPITFKLGGMQAEMVELVKKLCEPLFVIFDYAEISNEDYRKIVTEFVNGKIT